MKTDTADLKLMSMIMREKGFGILEGILRKKMYDSDTLSGITGNTFEDGLFKGIVTGMKIYLLMIEDIKKEIKEMNREDK